MQIFFDNQIDKIDLEMKRIEILNKENFNHFVNSLRIKEKEKISVIKDSIRYFTEVEKITKSGIILNIVNSQKEENSNTYFLFMGLPKGQKMELVIEKTTEIGVDYIYPVEMTRSIVKKKDIKKEKLERWNKKAYSASEQSQRISETKVMDVIKVEDILNILEEKKIDYLFVFYEKGSKLLKEVIMDLSIKDEFKKEKKSIAFLVGTEGGITENEISILKKSSKTRICFLGNNILRTETAPIYGMSVLKYIFD